MPTPTQEIMQRLQLELAYARNRERQQIAEDLQSYYAGVQLEGLDEALSKQFADPASLKLQPAIDNLVRFVADETSRVFDSPPKLSSDNIIAQALLDEMMENGLLAVALKTCEVYANLTGVCALHSWWDSQNNIIKHTIIPSSVLFVAQREDDPTEAEAVIYGRMQKDTISTAAAIKDYVHWDDESCFIFTLTGGAQPPSVDNPQMINPYNVMPFAFFRDSAPVSNFFGAPDEALLVAQDTLNILLTSANQLAKYQSFSQPVMIGCDPKNPVIVDPSKPIRIPAANSGETQPKFEFVTPASKIKDILDMANDLIERTCTRRGISMTALKTGASTMSGYALKIANSRLDRKRKDDIPLHRAALQQWWEVVKRIHNAHNPIKVPLDAKIVIDFAEPEYEDDPTTVIANAEKEIALGLTSPVAIIMQRNPDLTEDEAKEVYLKNKSFAADITKPEPKVEIKPTPKPEMPEDVSDDMGDTEEAMQ